MKSEAGILLLPSTDFQTLNAKAIEIFNLIDASEATRLEYTSRIGEFFLFINENGIHADTFLSFKRVLEKRTDIKLSTKSKYLTTAKIFLRVLFKAGLLHEDIILNVKSFTNRKSH